MYDQEAANAIELIEIRSAKYGEGADALLDIIDNDWAPEDKDKPDFAYYL